MSTTEADDTPLYEARKKIYPAAVQGRFRNIKSALLILCLGFYYFLPFVRWDRGPNAPDQAVLVDFNNTRFYFFFIEIWPQEVYYFTGLLIMAAMALFLMNAVAGRVWCGYLCPQTVWTDLFYWVERVIEGDRRERMKKDQGRLTLERMTEIVSKHTIWLIIAWATGGAWVLYFADAPTLVKDLATGHAPAVAYIWIAILTFTTYTLAGHMREQVCVYMCPWPRIQAALTDEWALNVTYKYDRGEPRTSAKKAEALRARGEAAGDCVDCGQCVAVCPTGVDIRHGPQLGCIQCGLCIDACNTVMSKIGRAPDLIGYDNDINIHHREKGEPEVFRLVRARTLIYVAIIAVVGIIMLGALVTRSAINVNVLHDRNPLFVTNSDGSIRNGYTLRVFNTHREDRIYTIALEGLEGARLEVVGETGTHGGQSAITIGPDQTRELRVLVVVPTGTPIAASTPVVFRVTDTKDGATASRRDNFIGP